LTKVKRVGSIEISEDLDFQRRSWIVQRVGWGVMLAISLSGLFGVFGDGPLASADAGTESSGLRIEYERFVRQEAPGALIANVGAASVRPDSTVQIWLDRKWLEKMEVKEVTPEPYSSRLEPDRVLYTFGVNPTSMPVRITWYLQTHALGRSSGRIGISGGPTISYSQFAYP
jgi:hypothetical protein